MRPIEPVSSSRIEPTAPVRPTRRVYERPPEEDEERRREHDGDRRRREEAEQDGHVDVRA